MTNGVETDLDSGMRSLAPGFIRFSIKANDTEENQQIHDAFREFCKVECDNNYTLGLKALLQSYQADAKFEALYDLITQLKTKVDELEAKNKPVEKKEEEGVF